MANDFADRIARLKDKKNKLAGQLGALEQKAKAASRKLDTRRKIIVGGAVLAHMEKDATFASAMQKLLGAYVGRPLDREAIADLLAPKSPPAIQQAPPPRSIGAAPCPRTSRTRSGAASRSNARAAEFQATNPAAKSCARVLPVGIGHIWLQAGMKARQLTKARPPRAIRPTQRRPRLFRTTSPPRHNACRESGASCLSGSLAGLFARLRRF